MALKTNDPPAWDWVGRAVREATPEVPVFTAAERDALWQRIEDRPTVAKQRRPRSRRTVVAGTIAALAIGGAGVAVAEVYSAHTGIGPVDAEDKELGGPGERLDPAAPDFAHVVDEITRDIRFPSEEARQRSLDFEADDSKGESGPVVSTGAIRLWMAGHAICSWTDQWAIALRSGDVETQRAASEVVLSATTWPAITDTDPEMANESEFAWLPDLQHAIEADRPRAARDALFGNSSCMPDGLTTDLGLGTRP